MKRQLIILLAAVTFTVAMVPKLRRAVNLEEELRQTMASSASTVASGGATSATLQVCKPETPCAWSIYVNRQKIIDTNIVNTYCNCKVGTECQFDEDDENLNAFIHRCRPTNHNEDKTES
ncbi:uncharacterized protein LOC106710643 isoform X1 [Papilio machaon]|uniref:uncharacterized protein LOC106710643 isoform X1 n=1 Tax=Papilio machaon TaxID=76193 RepID=UPI001E665DDA|nr:uncharacterized protein LOC106710643 isoform X1 [Papilio machaon]